MLAANQPLVVPMLLRLSNFKLSSYVVLVVSKPKGITLVFKTDPLQNVDISSTFDSITVIQKFIQKEIEGQLRQMFREDLPSIIHRLSQQWIKRSTTVEAPYLKNQHILHHRSGVETMSNPDVAPARATTPSDLYAAMGRDISAKLSSSPQHRFSSSHSISGRPSLSNMRTLAEKVDSPFGYSDYMMADDASERSQFSHLGRIHRESKGLADLAEERSEFDDTDGGSFDMLDWDDTMTDILNAQPLSDVGITEYESIPAVGGGTITRPRVYHASSLLRSNSSISPIPTRTPSFAQMSWPEYRLSPQSLPSTRKMSLRSYPFTADRSLDLSFPEGSSMGPLLDMNDTSQSYEAINQMQDDNSHPLYWQGNSHKARQRAVGHQRTETSEPASPSQSTSNDGHLGSFVSKNRRDSISSSAGFYRSRLDEDDDADHKIILRPGVNNAISQLSLLNRSNHTLSPYTRTLEHLAFRSVPPKAMLSHGASAPMERQPVKAKRKRTYHLGKSTKPVTSNTPLQSDTLNDAPLSPSTTSDLSTSDIDRYFRSRDDLPATLHGNTTDIQKALYARHRYHHDNV